jgi:pimeloyl-ACP methyl ester carboxylesterase
MGDLPGQQAAEATPGPTLHTVERGRGPHLILVHGVAGSHMVWDDISPELEPYFTLLSIDLLGYGHSPKPRTEYTPTLHADAIRRTLRQAGIDPPYVLVGLSMGANLVLEFARRWPDEVSGLVGIGFPYYPSGPVARVALQHNAWIRLTLRHPIVAAVATPVIWRIGRHVAGLFRNQSTLYSPAVAADALRARYLAFRSSLFNCMVHFRQDDVLDASGEMRRLFIHGDDDQWAPAEAIEKSLAKYANTTVRVIEGPHNLVVAQAAMSAALIVEHLGAGPAPDGPQNAVVAQFAVTADRYRPRNVPLPHLPLPPPADQPPTQRPGAPVPGPVRAVQRGFRRASRRLGLGAPVGLLRRSVPDPDRDPRGPT